MSLIKKEMESLKDDLQKGMKKAEFVMKDTVEDIKDDAQGIKAGMEIKKDEMMEEYEKKKFSKELENQMKKEQQFK
ncbi:hypothetical protein QOZ83_05315 [Romboutsia sedimentorum]|uniref:hypothetical protein n=1 Tax=Romboutsia sedimentorum TaxID=1368474 RepID=UPI0024DE09A1|nr:hypothetical protein [Romboutsia sedimentorum]MDK2585275.1 hypothetical protein [Romboutsia sedimentorum]